MNDGQSEIRERYLAGWQARMKHHEMDDEHDETREHHLGIGIALGTALGVAIGAGLGLALGNLALGIGVGLALGVAFGLIVGAKRSKTAPGSSDATGRDSSNR